MTDPLAPCVVRILSPAGRIVGAGFLAEERRVFTCAHVVKAALGPAAEQGINRTVLLDFPLLAPGATLPGREIPLQQPVQGDGGQPDDIALLEIEGDLPAGSEPATLVTTDDLWENAFRAFGFPTGYDNGQWARGVVLGPNASGWVQIEDADTIGYFVQPGFSGGPVWDDQQEGVIGMVVAAERRAEARTAYAIPAARLIESWPSLAPGARPPCPYRGLLSFGEQDARFFYGREAFVEPLVEAARKQAIVPVVGPSGIGKSSVVLAGLVPRLRADGDWLIASCRPGVNPFDALARTLVPLLTPELDGVREMDEVDGLRLRLEQGDLPRVLEMIREKHPETRRLLLVIDQFEEIYTQAESGDEGRRFLDAILSLAPNKPQRSSSFATVVLTLRADFLETALLYRPFVDVLQADLKLAPMTGQELRTAIEKPAILLHVRYESGLVDRIVDAVDQDPWSLPLLEFALTRLWPAQQRRLLTNKAYDQIGGIEQALTNHAEEVFGKLDADGQARVRQIFLQLVQPGDKTRDSRRLASRAELGESNWELVNWLAGPEVRLLVCRESNTVEVVHEALIWGWERLRNWIEADRAFRTWQEGLRSAIRLWEASEQDPEALLGGRLLEEARKQLRDRPGDLSPQEQGFIQESVKRTEEEQAAEQERRTREARDRARLHAMEQQRLAAAAALAARKNNSWYVIAAPAVGILVALLVILLQSLPFFARFELSTYDFMFGLRPHSALRGDISLIGIDQGRVTPMQMATALIQLGHGHPKAIGLDYQFPTPLTKGEVSTLAHAVKSAGVVTLPVEVTHRFSGSGGNFVSLNEPDPAVEQAANRRLGAVNLATDVDGEVRAADLTFTGPGGTTYYQFAARLAALGLGQPVSRILTSAPAHHFLINYVPAPEANTSQLEPLIDQQYSLQDLQSIYGGQIVIIYDNTTNPSVQHNTPLGTLNDGLIQADILNTFLQRNPIKQADNTVNAMIIVLFAALTAIAVWRLSIWLSLAATGVVALGYAAAAILLFRSDGYWVHLLASEVAVVLSFAAAVRFWSAIQEREKRRTDQIVEQYVKTDVVEPENAMPSTTVLCVGLHDVPAATAQLHPAGVDTLLDMYRQHVTASVERFQGAVVEYAGERLSARWTASRHGSNHAMRAAACAFDLIKGMEQLEGRLQTESLPALRYGIGIESGDADPAIGGPRSLSTAGRQTLDGATALCNVARSGEILVGEKTWTLVGSLLDVEEVEQAAPQAGKHAQRAFRAIGLISTEPAVAVDIPV